MRILYVAMRHDYGHPEWGDSFEHCNFFDSLDRMGHEILYFDFPTVMSKLGRKGMNQRLGEVAQTERPDLMFTVLFRDELDPETIRKISDLPDTTTVNWFCDDHWRFDGFSRHWAPAFNWVVTTDSAAVAKYAAIGCTKVIKSQWAANHFMYRKLDVPLKYDVTFVGKPHGNRRDLVEALRDVGIRVDVWGNGWGHGRAGQQEMIEIFNASRINLNLSNASGARRRHKWQRVLDRSARGVRRCLGKTRSVDAVAGRFPASNTREQIKGRNFEVVGCGGFLLTGSADNLSEYFDLNREVVAFGDFRQLVSHIQHFLDHEDQRVAIAEAGHRRTLAAHTYEHRFQQIFQRMGLSTSHHAEPGHVCSQVAETPSVAAGDGVHGPVEVEEAA